MHAVAVVGLWRSPVFLPGESHGQRSPAGYGPWGGQELDMTEHAHMESNGGNRRG